MEMEDENDGNNGDSKVATDEEVDWTDSDDSDNDSESDSDVQYVLSCVSQPPLYNNDVLLSNSVESWSE